MGLIRRRATSDGDESLGKSDKSDTSMTDDNTTQLQEQAQEVMKDNLELMKEVVLHLREDDQFASTIYADCPRLQHLLEKHPDLRPIFEDPKLVRINFEQVYKDAGGVLPEDEKKPSRLRKCISTVVNHPLFKVLKLILFIKKIFSCITGGGIGLLKNCFRGALGGWCMEDVADAIADEAGDAADGLDNNHNAANKAALNQAADHMEDPEVQERMHEILNERDPDALQDAIDRDPELRALRDSNPLCAELMQDPDTMRILTEPDNLRALGDCPDLIEQDFANPDWTPDDIETGSGELRGIDTIEEGDFEDGDVDEEDIEVDLESQNGDQQGSGNQLELENADEEGGMEQPELEKQQSVDQQRGSYNVDADEGGGGGGGGIEDFEMGDAEEPDAAAFDDFEMGDAEDPEGRGGAAQGGGGKGGNKSKQQTNQKQNRGGGFMSSLAAGMTDFIAAEMVGVSVSEIMGGSELDAIDDVDQAAEAVETAGTSAEDAATGLAAAAEAAEGLMEEDFVDNLDNLEDGMDEFEDAYDNAQESEQQDRSAAANAAATGAAVGAVEGGILVAGVDDTKKKEGQVERDVEASIQEIDTEVAEDGDEPKRKGRFKWVGNMAAALSTAAKEQVASALLGDDFGEMVVEKMEEDDEDKDEEKADGAESGDDSQDAVANDRTKSESKKSGFLRRGK